MKKDVFQKIKKELFGIQKNVPLAKYTTFRIGGLAKYFFVAKNKEEIISAILVAKKLKLSFFILGGGSNILVSDRGFKGLVIKVESRILKVEGSNIYAGAGVSLNESVSTALENNLTGFEWGVGIPGTVGGAIYGNAGAFGKSIADVVKSVEVLDVKNLETKKLKNKNCKFGYRDSVFKRDRNLILLSAIIQLKKGKKSEIKRKIKEFLDYRQETQPLNFPSAGSVFKNQKSKIKNKKLLRKYPELKEFNKKGEIPAGWLIERCNLKGKKIGKAKISEKHANFIVNLGGAKAKDVKELIKLIKQKVKIKFGIVLEEEIQHLGFKN